MTVNTLPAKETKRMKEHEQWFPTSNHVDPCNEIDNSDDFSFSLEQPTPLKIVDSFNSAESGRNS